MNPPKTPTQVIWTETIKELRKAFRGNKPAEEVFDDMVIYMGLLERENRSMREALSFPDGIHITVDFTGCTTPASFMAAIKEAGNDLERQKEQVLSSLTIK